MQIKWRVTTRMAVCCLLIWIRALAATAGEPAANVACSPLIENKGETCYAEIWTYRPKAAPVPFMLPGKYTPIAFRARPKSTVIVRVYKRPLEVIQTEIDYSQSNKPDIAGTIVTQLLKPLTGLTITTNTNEGAKDLADLDVKMDVDLEAVEQNEARDVVPPPVVKELTDYLSNLQNIKEQQENTSFFIKKQIAALGNITKQATAAQQFSPVLSGGSAAPSWDNAPAFSAIVDTVVSELGDATAKEGTPEGHCDFSALSTAGKIYPLPARCVERLKITVAELPTELANIQSDWTSASLSKGDRAKYAPLFSANQVVLYRMHIDHLADRQATLADNLKTAQTGRATISQSAQAWTVLQGKLAACGATPSTTDCLTFVIQDVAIPNYMQPNYAGVMARIKAGQITGQATLTAQPLISQSAPATTSADPAKSTTPVGIYSVTWNHQPWEASAGVMWSNAVSRTFSAPAVIANGKTVLDSSGKLETVVTQTTSSPTVDAVVLLHRRFFESPMGTHRFAILGTAGVGTGTASSVDGLAGISFAWGSLYISPLLQWTRDTKLIGGVKLGDNLGPQPPALPTEKYWVHKLGISITYALPTSSN